MQCFTCGSWHRYSSVHTLGTVAQVSFTVDAQVQLRRMVGLRARVKRAVLGVESALEIRKLGAGYVHKDAPLLIRVGPDLVTYSLDRDSKAATILGAEQVQETAA